VLFDSGRLHQVLMNLAVNARDAMPDGGRLVLETALIEADDRDAAALHALPALPTPGGGAVLIAVTDTGTGMDEATRARIFEPFFTTKEPGLGTGLGLATTHSIVAEAGGRIVVESEPGLGTAFRIYLPRAEAAAAVEDAAIGPAPQSHDGRTVLVVEDEPAVRGVIRTVLEEAGYSVVEAGSGDSAMDALRSTDPGIHLLLTDIVLPGSSGRDVARSAVEARPDLPVVFMSGYRDSVLGPDSWFLEKPFTADALLDVVARALG
jgi:CheY-like chemotaxis protein